MGPTEVLAELTRRGVEVEVEGDRLRFRPQSAVTPDLRSALIEHKADLIRLLGPDDEVAWRIAAMRSQVPRTGPIPCLLARPEAKTAPDGTCVSCGDPLASDRRIRCVPCVEAIGLVRRPSGRSHRRWTIRCSERSCGDSRRTGERARDNWPTGTNFGQY